MIYDMLRIAALALAIMFAVQATRNYLRLRRLIRINQKLDQLKKTIDVGLINVISSLSQEQLDMFGATIEADRVINGAIVQAIGKDAYNKIANSFDDHIPTCMFFLSALGKIIEAEQLKRKSAAVMGGQP